mgnify:FL=1
MHVPNSYMSEAKYYLLKENEPVGPYSSSELIRLVEDGIIMDDMKVAAAGTQSWLSVKDLLLILGDEDAQSEQVPLSAGATQSTNGNFDGGCAGCLVLGASLFLLLGIFAIMSAWAGYTSKEVSGYEVERRSDYIPDRGMPLLKREPVWSTKEATVTDRVYVGVGGLICIIIGCGGIWVVHKASRQQR